MDAILASICGLAGFLAFSNWQSIVNNVHTMQNALLGKGWFTGYMKMPIDVPKFHCECRRTNDFQLNINPPDKLAYLVDCCERDYHLGTTEATGTHARAVSSLIRGLMTKGYSHRDMIHNVTPRTFEYFTVDMRSPNELRAHLSNGYIVLTASHFEGQDRSMHIVGFNTASFTADVFIQDNKLERKSFLISDFANGLFSNGWVIKHFESDTDSECQDEASTSRLEDDTTKSWVQWWNNDTQNIPRMRDH